jgi:uncharacterized protein
VPVDQLRPLRINAVELLRQPGAERDVAVTLPPGPLDVVHDRLAGDISVALRLQALHDGIAVDGAVTVPWSTVCRRCLVEVTGSAVVEVDELYQVELLDPDAFRIDDGQLDLAPLVRESALLELDRERLCRDDCAGLCPVCGIDRNSSTCACDTAVRDERWAALDEIVLDDDDRG